MAGGNGLQHADRGAHYRACLTLGVLTSLRGRVCGFSPVGTQAWGQAAPHTALLLVAAAQQSLGCSGGAGVPWLWEPSCAGRAGPGTSRGCRRSPRFCSCLHWGLRRGLGDLGAKGSRGLGGLMTPARVVPATSCGQEPSCSPQTRTWLVVLL